MKPLIPLLADNYDRHYIHGDDRVWAETNCYVDVLIELIHSMGFDPVAGLAFTVAVDFESDQWTFFKYQHSDLLDLYGFQIEELNPWRRLVDHVEEQVSANRPVLVEVDSYFLPDTAGTAYKSEHVKSTIAVNLIDVENEHLGYFHGQGYYELSGADFCDLFQTSGLAHERMLPPYIELVKCRHTPTTLSASETTCISLASLKRQLILAPTLNPFEAFELRFKSDLEWLLSEPIEAFHSYSFANLRQYGACFELVATYLSWLNDRGESGLSEAISCFTEIASASKIFQFKLARSIARNKSMDLSSLGHMAELWQSGIDTLRYKYL